MRRITVLAIVDNPPDVREHKPYERNVGAVLRTNAEGGGRAELVTFTKE